MGQAEGGGAYQSCLSCCPSLVSWVPLRKKAMKWPRLWGKSCFLGLDGSVLSFLVITVRSSLLAEPPSSTFVLWRDTVGTGYSITEPRQVSPSSPQQSGTKWEMGGEGQSRDLLDSQEEQGVSRNCWAPAQGVGWDSQASTWQQTPWNWAHSGLCHSTALFIQVTFLSTLFLFLTWPRFLLMMIICVFIKVSLLAVSLAECIPVSPTFNDMFTSKTITSFRCTSEKHLRSGKYYAFLNITTAPHKRKQPQNAPHLSCNKEMPCGAI